MNPNKEDCASEVIGMSREAEKSVSLNSFYLFVFGLIVLMGSGAVLATEGDEQRTSVSRHHVTGGRDNPTTVTESEEEYDGLVTSGERTGSDTRGASAKGSGVAQKGSSDFWFYEADVILFNDDDLDGYFYGVDLLFDVDTIYDAADVYAVLYLSYEGGPWNEYAATEDFTIYGASGSDEYVIVSELMTGYPTGSYDLLIELFDAWDGTYLTSFGPADTSELSYLPLEDFDRDKPLPPVREVVIVEQGGGGGSVDGWFLAAMFLVLLAGGIRRICRHRNDALMRIDSPAPIWRSNGETTF
jgi:hypothetical protein